MRFSYQTTYQTAYLTLVFTFLILGVFSKDTFSSSTDSPVIDQLKSIPLQLEKNIDYVEVLSLISKDWNPKIILNSVLIDRITENIRQKIIGNHNPEFVLKTMRDTIFFEEKFNLTESVDSRGFPLDPNEWFFYGLLQSKRGYCMTLSLLYLIIGERLGLPLYGVALPNHFFVRYDSPKYRVNIETTRGGEAFSDKFYYRRFDINSQSSFFMKNLSKKHVLGAYFSNIGIAYFNKNLTNKSVFYLRLAREINPLSIEVRNNLGNILSEMKLIDQAIKEYEAAWNMDSNNKATLLNLAIAYSEAGLNKQAIEMFLQVVQISPNSVIAHGELSRLYLNQKQLINALLHLKKLSRLEPKNLQHILQMADVYLRLSNPILALNILKDTQLAQPFNFHIKERLAEIYYRLKKFDRSIEELRYLIEQHPDSSRAYMQLGWTYFRTGNLKMAIVWTKRGLNKGKKQFTLLGYMNLGFFYLMEKKYSVAKNWYQKVLKNKNPKIMQGMIQDLNDAARRNPDFIELEFFSGWLHFEGGQGEKARPHLEYYLSKNPQGPHASDAQNLLEKINSGLIKGLHSIPGKAFPNKDTPKSMVEIPAGEFIMGSNKHGSDERPAHKVYLDAFYIDKYEVSSEEYAKFLNEVGKNQNYYRLNKYGTLKYDKKFFSKKKRYPINNVSWVGANAYCRWIKKRLPTEAEWEKAARGFKGGVFPWGNELPRPWKARFDQYWQHLKLDVLVPVDSMSEGKSSFGVYHMAGNVKEWVADWYDREYYKRQDHKINPPSPPGGIFKVLKGGSWNDLAGFIYSSFRNNSRAEIMLEDYGFRCAKSVGSGSN